MPDFNRGKLDMFDSTGKNSNLNAAAGGPPRIAVAGVDAPSRSVLSGRPPQRQAQAAFLAYGRCLPDSHDQRLGEETRGGARKFSNFAGLLPVLLFGIAMPAAAQTVIFQETFGNGNATATGNPIVANNYVSPSGITYTGATNWLTRCNGMVTAGGAPAGNAVGAAQCSNDPASWWGSGMAQRGVGLYTTNAATGAWFAFTAAQRAQADQSISITAYTSGAAPFPPGEVILQNVQPIPFPAGAVPPGGSGRFVTFQFVGGATNCDVGHPLVTVNLNGTQLGGTIDLCTAPASNVRSYGGIPMRDGFVSPNQPANTVRVGNYTPTGVGASALVTGGGLTFAMINRQNSGGGNDWAWDNFTAVDVSPSVTKTVDIASNYVGQVKRITFTVSNTNGDNGPKVGWGFTDTLPTNVVIAPTPNATTTCGAGTTMTATAGAGTFAVSGGNLIAGTAGGAATTCTISVNVTSNVLGTFTNTQANYTSSTALNIPNQSVPMTWVANTVTVTKISNGGTGTFNFSGGNGIANHSIATTAAGAPGTAGTQQTLVLTSTTTTTAIVEAAAAGWTVNGIPNCTVGGVALAGTTWTAGTQTLTLPALPLQAGAARNVQCTFTNVLVSADLSITKTNTFAPGQPSDQPNDTVAHGATTTYTLVATNNSPAVVTGAIVRDVPVSGITCAGTNTVTIDYSGATPDTTSDVATLTGASGIVLGAIGNGEAATLTFSCTVN